MAGDTMSGHVTKLQANPCYDGTDSYYESLCQYRIKTDSDKPATVPSENIYDQGSREVNKRPSVSRANKKWMTCLTVVVILQTLCLVVLFALAGHFHLQSNQLSQQLSSSLEQKTHPLNMELNETIERNQVEIEASLKSYIQFSMNTLNTTTMDQLSDLQSSVNTLNNTAMDTQSSVNTIMKGQLSDLRSSVSILNTTTMDQLKNVQSLVNTLNTTTMGQLSDLQSSVNKITSSSVDLYQGCSQLTRSCTVSTIGFWRGCVTQPINPTVSSMLKIKLKT